MRMDLNLRSMEIEGKLAKDLKELKKKINGNFEKNYQRWYSESSSLIRQIMLERINEFESYYMADPKRKTVDVTSYKIQD